MKINENDFKHLKNRKKILFHLHQLGRLKEEQSPYPLFHLLMAEVGQGEPQEAIPTIFPYLVGMAMESRDFSFVNMVVTLKIGFYQREDLNKLSDLELRHYVAALYNLKGHLPLKPPKNKGDWEQSFTELYVWNCFLIHSFSPDLLLLSRYGRFDKAFKVKCLHCGNDIHSLFVNPEEENGSITPAPVCDRDWDYLFADDVYQGFTALCANYNEEYFAKILPYVYGQYRCSVCQEENQVMAAAKAYLQEEEPWFVADEVFLQRMRRIAFCIPDNAPLEKWFFGIYVLSLYRGAYGLADSRGIGFMLEIAQDLPHDLPDSMLEDLLKQALDLDLQGDYGTLVCHVAGAYYQKQGDKDRAMGYYQQGIESGKTGALMVDYLCYCLTEGEDSGEQNLLDFYDVVEEEHLRLKLDEFLVIYYRDLGNIPRSIIYQKEVLRRTMEQHPENLLRIGEAEAYLGSLYLEEGQYDLAEKHCDKALAEHSGFLQKEKVLPRMFGGKKWRKQPKGQVEQLENRGRLMAMVLTTLGHVSFQRGNYPKALGFYQRASVLWNWFSTLEFVEQGNQAYFQGQAYEKMGKKKKAKALLLRAQEIYERRMGESKVSQEVEECQRRLPSVLALLENLR